MKTNHPSVKKLKEILSKTNIPTKKREKLLRNGTLFMITSKGYYKDKFTKGLNRKNKIKEAFNYIFNNKIKKEHKREFGDGVSFRLNKETDTILSQIEKGRCSKFINQAVLSYYEYNNPISSTFN